MNTLLEFKNVSLTYQTYTDEITAIDDLSFSIDRGEFVSFIGPSGCGKTTILSLVAGLIKPTSGKIILGGREIQKPDGNLGYMLQKDQLFPWRTIEKNVILPLEILRKNTSKNREYANDLLDKYGLKNFKKYYPDQLSGGMRQRVALIRTMVYRPDLLLLDEPFSALDYQTRLQVCDDVYKIIKAENKTAILVTHDITEAISMSDKIIVLTSRPAKLMAIHKPHIIGETPIKKRESEKFSGWFEKIWKELN